MEIICPSCTSKYSAPDEKIPRDKAFRVTCPQCKEKITVEPAGEESPSPPAEEPPFPERTPGPPREGAAAEAPMYDASSADYFEEGAKTAMVCISSPQRTALVKHALEEMKYIAVFPDSPEKALHRLKFNKYDLVVVDEEFCDAVPERNEVLLHLQNLTMGVRRHLFLVLLSSKIKSFDNMMAFVKSVNLAVNHGDLANFKNILKRALAEHETFYKVFVETLRELGKR